MFPSLRGGFSFRPRRATSAYESGDRRRRNAVAGRQAARGIEPAGVGARRRRRERHAPEAGRARRRGGARVGRRARRRRAVGRGQAPRRRPGAGPRYSGRGPATNPHVDRRSALALERRPVSQRPAVRARAGSDLVLASRRILRRGGRRADVVSVLRKLTQGT